MDRRPGQLTDALDPKEDLCTDLVKIYYSAFKEGLTREEIDAVGEEAQDMAEDLMERLENRNP